MISFNNISSKYKLDFKSIVGMTYNPFFETYKLGEDTSVNYIVEAKFL